MKKIAGFLAAALIMLSMSGCKEPQISSGEIPSQMATTASEAGTAQTTPPGETKATVSAETETRLSETTAQTTPPGETETTVTAKTETKLSEGTAQTTVETTSAVPETAVPKSEKTTAAEKPSVEKDGSYTTPEDVAEYIHTFGTLPKNFITKDEAKALGWDSKKGNLWDVADGKSIGGDRFGNYEGLLPAKKGRTYTECDVNYSGGFRGSERVVFSNDGLIYYTGDHYQTFTKLY